MMKFLGTSFVLAGAALLAGCAGDGELPEQPEQQSASGFTEAPQTLTTKTTALPLQSDSNGLRSAVDAERDIAFVGGVTKVSALRLATRQHLWQLTLEGGVDQLFFDTEGRRLYVSTASTLYVVEPMTGAVLHSTELSSPVVAITYLSAKTASAQGQLIIGQRANSSEWLLSAFNPDTLAAVASTTLPAIEYDAKLQITAGAGLIWTMNYQGPRLYTIRPYLLMGDVIYPIDNHQVVDSLRDTGLMISPDGEWLITGGNNLLSTALDSEAQEYFEWSSRGFDHFSPTVTGGGMFTGPGFELIVRDDISPNTDTTERKIPFFNSFSVSQTLSTVSGIYALGHHDELGKALQWVTSNRAANSPNATPVSLSASQTFIPFDGVDSHQQSDFYLSAVFAAGNGLATVQPVCYEPCTYAKTLEIPLLDEAQQAYIDIHQLTDGPISGVIVTASGDVQMGEAEWSLNIPSACPSGAQITGDINSDDLLGIGYQDVPCETVISNDPEINSIRICAPDPTTSFGDQFTGSVEATNIDTFIGSCNDEERSYNFSGHMCAVETVDCQTQLQLFELSCFGSVFIDGSYDEEAGGRSLPIIELINNATSSSSSSAPIFGEIGQETGSSSSESQPNDITGTITVHPDFLDDLSFQPSKTTCF